MILLPLLLPACNGGSKADDAGEDPAWDVFDGDADIITDDGLDLPDEGPCAEGETLCGTECVDLNSDPDHCGACDNPCPEGQVCYGATCRVACPEGLTQCAGSCVDIMSDPDNCGACGNVCPTPPNSEAVCISGTCDFDCLAGWVDANGNPDDGCEEECVFTSPDEICNGLDENCDGTIDEGFDCAMGDLVVCTTICGGRGTGICTADCLIPGPEDCNPPRESCNGRDDDCDGAIDNGFDCIMGEIVDCTTDCGTPGTGACTAACEIPTGSGCATSDPELCNGLDDNCNGEIDETFPCVPGEEVSCTTSCGSEGTGPCTAECQVPPPEGCTPPAETCNGIDDDCDGSADNGFECAAGIDTQSCGNCGTQSCLATCTWGVCTGEGECSPGDTQSCGTCGTQTCGSDCTWGECVEGECAPGEVRSCGNCGTQTCGSDCTWSVCTGEGVCSPGTTRPCSMGPCSGTETCSASCTWGSCVLGPAPSHDLCAGAATLWTGGTMSGSTCGAANDYTSVCGADGPDVVYTFVLSSATDVFIGVYSSDFDPVLHLSATCGGDDHCNDNAYATVSGSALVLNALPAGTYYVVVDSATSAAGRYYIESYIDFAGSPGDSCGNPMLLQDGVSGDTSLQQDNFVPDCRRNDLTDAVYYFFVESTGVVTTSTCGGAAWDTVLFYRDNCESSFDLDCNDNACGQQSTVSAVFSPGIYFLYIDGFREAGPYTLSVTGL